jgi:hypothetical protein
MTYNCDKMFLRFMTETYFLNPSLRNSSLSLHSWQQISAYPNGACAGICAGTLVFISLIIGYLATFSCHMIEVKDSETNINVGFGLFNREDLLNEYTYDCVSYTEKQKDVIFDANWRSARAMGVLMVIFAIILGIVMLVIICCGIPKKGAIVLGVFSLLTSLFAFLELLMLNSEFCNKTDCKLGYSGGVAIVTGVLLFFATIPICMFRDVPRKPRAKKEKKEAKKEKEADEENQKEDEPKEEEKEETKEEDDKPVEEEQEPVTEEDKGGFEDEPKTEETPEIELTEGELILTLCDSLNLRLFVFIQYLTIFTC